MLYFITSILFMARRPRSRERVDAGARLTSELRAARIRSGHPATYIAQIAGISVDTLRAIEGGRVTDPGFLTVAALAAALDLDLAELVAAATVDT